MKNLSANKLVAFAACAASTASSKSTTKVPPTTIARDAPWVVKNISRGGSRSSGDGDGSARAQKSSSPQNRSGKKKKSTKSTKEETKSTSSSNGSSSSSSNPMVEEILQHDNLYEILGVSKSATEREIQKAYRKRCVQTHPDKTGGDRRAFDKVAEAYDILSEPSKRETYNRFGKAGLDPTNPSNGAAFGGGGAAADMFRNMFQQAQQQRQQQQRRNQNLRYQLEVSLEDLYHGRIQSVMVALPINRHQGYRQQRQQRKEVEVHIEKGSLSGQSIVMSGEVDFNDDNSPPGDIVFILAQARHATFSRKGHDLAMTLKISLEEALCGLRRPIKYLDGSELWIESATKEYDQSSGQNSNAEKGKTDIDGNDDADSMTSSMPITIRTGDVQVLKGRGMPKRNQNGDFGDLYIQYEVEMPQNSRGRSTGSILTQEEYKDLSRLLLKLEENGGMRSKSNVANRRKKSSNRSGGPKIHFLREAKSSDFGTASGRVALEEEDGTGGSFHEEQEFDPFGSSFFGGQGFGGGRTHSQQFQFGAGSPFGGAAFGNSATGDDDGNVQCQQM